MERYALFLQQEVLLPSSSPGQAALVVGAGGVAYHLGDLLLPELRAVAGPGKAVPGRALAALLAPFGLALQQAGDQPSVNRIK